MKIAISETEWQEQVVQLAHLLGWQHLHVRRTIGRGKKWTTSTNLKGWPDLWCWHPAHGFAALELKVGTNQPTPEQVEVLNSLAQAGAHTMVAYPDDLEVLTDLLRGNGDMSLTEELRVAETMLLLAEQRNALLEGRVEGYKLQIAAMGATAHPSLMDGDGR
jgi:hypothetical protein